MEKHKRFIAELRVLLDKYEAILTVGSGIEAPIDVVYVRSSTSEGDVEVHRVCNEGSRLVEPGDPNWREIPEGESGISYMHCGLCLTEWKSGEAGETSPREYARQQGAWTKLGFQLWCNRHDANILHVDFNGQEMRANTLREEEE